MLLESTVLNFSLSKKNYADDGKKLLNNVCHSNVEIFTHLSVAFHVARSYYSGLLLEIQYI